MVDLYCTQANPMEIFHLKHDLKVFGFQVKTFPDGIGEAFDSLMKVVGEGFARSYYAIAYMSEEGPVYRATVAEKYDGEGAKYNYDSYTIEKGEYLSLRVNDWQQKTDMIKDVFDVLLQQKRADHSYPCIEWYKDENEMLCLVKAK